MRLLGNGALDPSFNFVGWTNVDVYAEAADDLATAIGTFPGAGPLPDPTWVVGYAEDPDTQPGGGPGTAGFVLKLDSVGAPDLDFGNLPQTGVVQSVDNRLDTTSGTIRVRAEFDNSDGLLLPGLYARVRLGGSEPRQAVLIDEKAIGTDQDKKYVLVVDADNKAAYREVTLGASVDGLRIVTNGLKSGERIVVNGLQRVRPGAVVAPQMVSMDQRSASNN